MLTLTHKQRLNILNVPLQTRWAAKEQATQCQITLAGHNFFKNYQLLPCGCNCLRRHSVCCVTVSCPLMLLLFRHANKFVVQCVVWGWLSCIDLPIQSQAQWYLIKCAPAVPDSVSHGHRKAPLLSKLLCCIYLAKIVVCRLHYSQNTFRHNLPHKTRHSFPHYKRANTAPCASQCTLCLYAFAMHNLLPSCRPHYIGTND